MNASTAEAGGASSSSSSSPPPPSPPPAARPPLRRDAGAGLIGGVAAGVANHLGVDVVLVRIGFVIATIFTQGLGAVAYLFGWVFIPEAGMSIASGSAPHPQLPAGGAGTPPSAGYAPPPVPGQASRPRGAPEERRGPSFWFGVALLTLGAIWFLGTVTGPGRIFGWIDGGVVIPLLLVGLGVALWRRSERPPAGTAPGGPTAADVGHPVDPEHQEATAMSAPPTTTTTPPGAVGPSVADGPATDTAPSPGSTAGSSGPAMAPPPPRYTGGGPPTPPPGGRWPGGGHDFTPPPVPTRERSILTRLVLGLTLLTAGVLWMLEIADITAIGPLRIAAIVLGMVGIGLLVGSVIGRGRLLILFGILLVPAVLIGSVLRGFPAMDLAWDVGSGGDIGEMNEQPVAVEDLRPVYRLGAGELELDLSELDLDPGTDVGTRIEMGAGEVVVIVPRDVDVVVDGRMAAGELEVFDQRRAGVGVTLEVTDLAEGVGQSGGTSVDDPAELHIDLSVGFGDVTIERTDR